MKKNEIKEGSELSKKLSIYHTIKNRCQFNRYFQRKVRPEYEFRYYLVPRMVCEDSVTNGGRGTGKSWDMEADIIHALVNSPYVPSEEVLITSLRELHLRQRMEAVITMLTNISFFKMFSLRVNRQPHYKITLAGLNNRTTVLWGISIGDDPLAKNIEGTHAYFRFIEETQQYPDSAYLKFTGAVHPMGSIDRYIGVNDGRQDQPYYKFQTKSKRFKGRVHKVPMFLESNWNQKKKMEKIEALKGEDSDAYKQIVLAEMGSPVSAVWDIKDIYSCMNKNVKYREIIITPSDYEDIHDLDKDPTRLDDFILRRFTELLPYDEDVVIGFDPAYSHDSHISIFAKVNNRWRLVQTVIMRNKVISLHQARIFSYLMEYYNAIAGIDCTSADGRDVAHTLMYDGLYSGLNYKNRIYMAEYTSKIFVGTVFDKEKNEEVDKYEDVKEYTTNYCRKMFNRLAIEIPLEEEILADFNAESIKVSTRKQIIDTPPTIHRPDSFRMLAYALYEMNYQPEVDSDIQPFALPTWASFDFDKKLRGGVI